MSANGTLEQLRLRLAEITDLHRTGSLLFWDQRTKMPPAGADARAEALATVGRIAHQKFVRLGERRGGVDLLRRRRRGVEAEVLDHSPTKNRFSYSRFCRSACGQQ